MNKIWFKITINKARVHMNGTTKEGLMLRYYAQNLQLATDDFENMVQSMKNELPSSFRLTKLSQWPRLTEQRYTRFMTVDDKKLSIQRTEFLSNAFKLTNLSRSDLRKHESAKIIKGLLIDDTDRGMITRQELVSMIPPVCLAIDESSRCLDMCASPGSKTSQLIDSMTAYNGTADTKINPRSAVIANDVNIQRCRILSHNLSKACHPGVGITCGDAAAIPKQVTFDRILADVPCSGDGTIRKNSEVWINWSPIEGVKFHSRQLKILMRGLPLLEVGGILVYSTCSLNPLEDEAVIAAALQEFPGEFKLKSLSGKLNFKSRAGLSQWKVPVVNHDASDFTLADTHDKNAINDSAGSKYSRFYAETMYSTAYSDDVLSQLTCSMRVLPHDNDTGGFFVCCFERIAVPAKVRRTRGHLNEKNKASVSDDSFIPVDVTHDTIGKEICDFYGIDYTKHIFAGSSSTNDFNLVINESCDRRVYLATPALTQLYHGLSSMNFIGFGVKAFEKLDRRMLEAGCFAYRLTSDGARWLLGYQTKRIVRVSDKACLEIMKMDGTSAALLHNYAETGDITGLETCKNQAGEIVGGGITLINEREGDDKCIIAGLISGTSNLQLLIKKNIREALIRLLESG